MSWPGWVSWPRPLRGTSSSCPTSALPYLRYPFHILSQFIGWVDFGLFYIYNKSTPEICDIPSKSTKNSKKKFFFTRDRFIMTFWVTHCIRVQKFLFAIWTPWVSKDAEFYIDFKNINLPL
jgi:hypothetical protein